MRVPLALMAVKYILSPLDTLGDSLGGDSKKPGAPRWNQGVRIHGIHPLTSSETVIHTPNILLPRMILFILPSFQRIILKSDLAEMEFSLADTRLRRV